MKKVRVYCACCGDTEYLLAKDIDRSERFLCKECDSRYIIWANSQVDGFFDGDRDALDMWLAHEEIAQRW